MSSWKKSSKVGQVQHRERAQVDDCPPDWCPICSAFRSSFPRENTWVYWKRRKITKNEQCNWQRNLILSFSISVVPVIIKPKAMLFVSSRRKRWIKIPKSTTSIWSTPSYEYVRRELSSQPCIYLSFARASDVRSFRRSISFTPWKWMSKTHQLSKDSRLRSEGVFENYTKKHTELPYWTATTSRLPRVFSWASETMRN